MVASEKSYIIHVLPHSSWWCICIGNNNSMNRRAYRVFDWKNEAIKYAKKMWNWKQKTLFIHNKEWKVIAVEES